MSTVNAGMLVLARELKGAMQVQLAEAVRLGYSQYQYLFRQVGRKGCRIAEPMPIPPG